MIAADELLGIDPPSGVPPLRLLEVSLDCPFPKPSLFSSTSIMQSPVRVAVLVGDVGLAGAVDIRSAGLVCDGILYCIQGKECVEIRIVFDLTVLPRSLEYRKG